LGDGNGKSATITATVAISGPETKAPVAASTDRLVVLIEE
jgi:hypothetical protein